jgi:ABC-type lipoprotein export system ATPase subunit
MNKIIEISNLSKSFPSPSGEESVHVFKNVDLAVEEGSSVAIVGPSGSGKSTLLNVIGLLDKPTQGKIVVDQQDHSLLSEEQISEYRNQTVGFVFQAHHLLPSCTVLENVMLPGLAGFNDSAGGDLIDRANQLLEEVGLDHRKKHLPSQISGGERQRVAVARSLINQPSVLLADEPTGALDQKNSDHLIDLLEKLNVEKCLTLIMVTHSLQCAKRMKQAYHLNEGSLEKQR